MTKVNKRATMDLTSVVESVNPETESGGEEPPSKQPPSQTTSGLGGSADGQSAGRIPSGSRL